MRNYPDTISDKNPGTVFMGTKGTLNGKTTGIFENTAQAKAFAYAKCDTQLKMTAATANNRNDYPTLVPQALNPLTATEIENINNENRRDNHPRNCAKANAISPYFSTEEITIPANHPEGTINLYSPRNNNFSNRESKFQIKIKPQGGGSVAFPKPVTQPSAFVMSKKVEFADEDSANYTSALEIDQPPFDPVENDDYGSGQKEGCTQEMLFTGSATSYLPVFAMVTVFIGLF